MRNKRFILLLGLLLTSMTPVGAIDSQIVLGVLLHPLTKRIAEQQLSRALPYRFDHKKNNARILAEMYLELTFSLIQSAAPHYLSGVDIDEYRQNIKRIAQEKNWDRATFNRVKRRLKIVRRRIAALEKRAKLKIAKYRVVDCSSFNAYTFGPRDEANVVITSRWLTSPLGAFNADGVFVPGPEDSGDTYMMSYLNAVLAHEFGHVALGHHDTQETVQYLLLMGIFLRLSVHNSRLAKKYAELAPLITVNPAGKMIQNDLYKKQGGREKEFACRQEYLNLLSTYPHLIKLLMERVLSRKHEYQADAWATQIIPAEDLIHALQFIERASAPVPWGFNLYTLVDKALPLYFMATDFISAVRSKDRMAELCEWALWYAVLRCYHTHPSTRRRVERLGIENIHQKNVWTDPQCWLTL